MTFYVKKPVVVEAMQYNNNANSYKVLHQINEAQSLKNKPFATLVNGKMIIPTLEGDMEAAPGDWIIKGIKGEFYSCKPDIFICTYDEVK